MSKNYNDLNKEIGSRLSNSRNAAHLTQAALAERANLSIQHISYLENGKRNLTLEVAKELSNILGVQENYLLCKTDFPTKQEEHINKEKLSDIRHSAFVDYLRSLGHSIEFEFKSKELIEYYDTLMAIPVTMRQYSVEATENEEDIEDTKKILLHGNQLKILFYGKTFITESAHVLFDDYEMNIADFVDLMEDINSYVDYSFHKILDRNKRKKLHEKL